MIIALLTGAFLTGSIPTGSLIASMQGIDLKSTGSGNIGATNVLRTTGTIAGITTLLLDIAKGYFAVWLAGRLMDHSPVWMSAAALAVMAGHAYPVFLKFKGGKAVASWVGAFLCLTPVALIAVLVVFVVVVAWTRYISMGSIIMAATLPLAIWLIVHPPLPPIMAAIVAGTFIIYKHSSNIQRLRSGQEHVFGFGAHKP